MPPPAAILWLPAASGGSLSSVRRLEMQPVGGWISQNHRHAPEQTQTAAVGRSFLFKKKKKKDHAKKKSTYI